MGRWIGNEWDEIKTEWERFNTNAHVYLHEEGQMALTIHTENGSVEVEYGDQFRHMVTGEIKTVHDIRPGSEKVVWADGSWDYTEDIEEAVRGENWAYEVHKLGEETYMPEEYLVGT